MDRSVDVDAKLYDPKNKIDNNYGANYYRNLDATLPKVRDLGFDDIRVLDFDGPPSSSLLERFYCNVMGRAWARQTCDHLRASGKTLVVVMMVLTVASINITATRVVWKPRRRTMPWR